MTTAQALDKWEAFAEAGITVSVCLGPVGPQRRVLWSVTAMTMFGQEFEQPFAAANLPQCLDIVEREARARGWL